MPAVTLSSALNHGCGPEWTKQTGTGRVNFKCPVCESETVFVNQEGQYIINTAEGQYLIDIKTGKWHELDADEKGRRGMAMPLVCGNGHDFEIDVSYEVTYDSLHLSATMSEYSYAQAYPEELIGYYSVDNQDLMRAHRDRLYAEHMSAIGMVGEPKGGRF